MNFTMHLSSRSLAAAAFALALMASGGAHAQGAVSGVPNAMQGFSQNRDQPIQIEAASLEMRDKKKEATFSGNVKVVQGDTTMTAKSLVVFYDSGPAAAAPVPATAKGVKTAPMRKAPCRACRMRCRAFRRIATSRFRLRPPRSKCVTRKRKPLSPAM